MKLKKMKSILFVLLLTAPCLIQSKKSKDKSSSEETETDKEEDKTSSEETEVDTDKGLEKVFGKNWKISDVKSVFNQDGDYNDDDDDLVESELFVMIDGAKDIKPMGKIKVKNSGVGSDYQAGGLNNYKQEVLNSHNAYRKQHGLRALKPSPFLDQKAQAAADRIAKNPGLWATPEKAHSSWDDLKHKDGSFIGENLYRNPGRINDPVKTWKGSKFHKERLDDRTTTHLGVGYARGTDGKQYTVGTYHPAGLF